MLTIRNDSVYLSLPETTAICNACFSCVSLQDERVLNRVKARKRAERDKKKKKEEKEEDEEKEKSDGDDGDGDGNDDSDDDDDDEVPASFSASLERLREHSTRAANLPFQVVSGTQSKWFVEAVVQ